MDFVPKTPVMEGGPAEGGGNRIRRFPGRGGLRAMSRAKPTGVPTLIRACRPSRREEEPVLYRVRRYSGHGVYAHLLQPQLMQTGHFSSGRSAPQILQRTV